MTSFEEIIKEPEVSEDEKNLQNDNAKKKKFLTHLKNRYRKRKTEEKAMQISIENLDDEVIAKFNGSIDEVAEEFLDYIKSGKYDNKETVTQFKKGTSIKNAEKLFDKIAFHLIKEDLLPAFRHEDLHGVSIEGIFEDVVNLFGRKYTSMRVTNIEKGEYRVKKPFVIKGKEKAEEKLETFEVIYKSDKVDLSEDGKLTGGNVRIVTEEERKKAKEFLDILRNPKGYGY